MITLLKLGASNLIYPHYLFRFSLECETYYTPDGGHQENIFNLSDSEKRDRIVDLIDIVKDNVSIAFNTYPG